MTHEQANQDALAIIRKLKSILTEYQFEIETDKHDQIVFFGREGFCGQFRYSSIGVSSEKALFVSLKTSDKNFKGLDSGIVNRVFCKEGFRGEVQTNGRCLWIAFDSGRPYSKIELVSLIRSEIEKAISKVNEIAAA